MQVLKKSKILRVVTCRNPGLMLILSPDLILAVSRKGKNRSKKWEEGGGEGREEETRIG